VDLDARDGNWVQKFQSDEKLGVTVTFPAPEVTPEVTPELRKMVEHLQGTMLRRELQSAMALKDDEHFRKAYLLPALKAGISTTTSSNMSTSDTSTSKGKRTGNRRSSGGDAMTSLRFSASRVTAHMMRREQPSPTPGGLEFRIFFSEAARQSYRRAILPVDLPGSASTLDLLFELGHE
jgi:hypothetical protein